MVAVVQKWGNSNAIRVPKVILNELSIKENDQISMDIVDDSIIIKKSNAHKTLKQRIKDFYGNKKPNKIVEKEMIVDKVGEEEW